METNNITNVKPVYTHYKYFCHICKATVPMMYKLAHNESLKHKTFNKIINDSFQRMKSYIDVDDENPDLTEGTTHTLQLYFCDTCAEAVEVDDQSVHTNSDAHKVNEAQLKMLEVLSSLVLEDIKPNNDISSDKYKEIIARSTDEHNVIDDDDDDGSENEDAADLDKYLEHVYLNNVDFVGICKQDCNGNNVEITTSNYDLIVIPIDNFVGYDLSVNGELQCNLCIDKFGRPLKVSTADRIKHIHTKSHLDRLALPIVGENYVRKLNNAFSHCGVCNSVVPAPIEDHFKYNVEHANLLENYNETGILKNKNKIVLTIFPGNSIEVKAIPKKRKGKGEQTLCSICNKYKCVNGMNSHEKGKTHLKKMRRLGFSVTTPSKVKANKVKDPKLNTIKIVNEENVFDHSPLYGNNIVFCNVCQKKVPNTLVNKSTHLNGSKHQSRC